METVLIWLAGGVITWLALVFLFHAIVIAGAFYFIYKICK